MKTTLVTVVAVFLLLSIHADQVEMQNGDHYVGKILSLDAHSLLLKSDVLGTIRLPRSKVANVAFAANTATNAPQAAAGTNSQPATVTVPATTNSTDLSASLKSLGSSTNFINQIRSQYLADAGPEANAKFNEMVSGLMSGNLNMDDLRNQAKKAAADLKQMKREVGDDTGLLDNYLGILDNFLQETASEPTAPPPAKQK